MNPACSTCGHEVQDANKHHGNYVMDMHHRPTFGPRPAGYGAVTDGSMCGPNARQS
jgi:hypothetical protein